MKRRWGKGDPVNLSDLLKITPVANEIQYLSKELNMTTSDLIWIVAQIIDNSEEFEKNHVGNIFGDDKHSDEEWNDVELEHLDDEVEQSLYMINVKINSTGRFPEIGFKAGINDKEDLTYFFDMVLEMLDKLE